MKKYKKSLIIISIVMVVLCACNIIFPLIFKDADQTVLLVTIISGWVSGVATFIVGLITYLQAKHYNDENTKFIEKQFELEQAKSIIQSRLLFVNDFKNMWTKFVDDGNPLHFGNELFALKNNISDSIVADEIVRIISESSLKTTILCNSIQNHLLLDYLSTDEKNQLQKMIEAYNQGFNDYFDKICKSKKINILGLDKLFNAYVNDFGPKFLEIINEGSKYLLKIEMDINFTINYKNDDIKYLKDQYSAIK